MPEFTHDFFSRYENNWRIWLAPFVGKSGLRFLEIGAFEGRCTLWLLENVLTSSSSTIHVVDTWKGGKDWAGEEFDWEEVFLRFRKNINNHRFQVYWFRERSDEVLRLQHPSFDFAYIDGDHSTAAVLSDSVLAFRLLKIGGMLIWDDYMWTVLEDRPGPAIDAFLQCYAKKLEIIHKGQQVVIRRTS